MAQPEGVGVYLIESRQIHGKSKLATVVLLTTISNVRIKIALSVCE